jgi:hypothetical protein
MKNPLAYLKDMMDIRLGRTTPSEAPVRIDGEPLLGAIDDEACEAVRFRASHVEPIEDEV